MIVFQKTKIFPIDHLSEQDRTVSTLLVPVSLMNELKTKKSQHGGNLAVYFQELLRLCRTFTHSGMLPDPSKIKTEYQEEGLELQRVSFRVSNEDWIELGELALAFGKSRCWVFTFLLKLDILGFWDALLNSGLTATVPTVPKNLLRASWSLRRSLDTFARNYYVRV